MLHLSLGDKFRRPVQQSFRDHLSATEYASFCTDFNRKGNRLSMQITEDHTPFSRDAPRHSWSISRDPDGPAAASIPAQSIATLLPADSGPADGSSGRVAPPASPPLTGVRRPRGTASPPAPGPPGSANKTAPEDHCHLRLRIGQQTPGRRWKESLEFCCVCLSALGLRIIRIIRIIEIINTIGCLNSK